jgi:hypothetical protein
MSVETVSVGAAPIYISADHNPKQATNLGNAVIFYDRNRGRVAAEQLAPGDTVTIEKGTYFFAPAASTLRVEDVAPKPARQRPARKRTRKAPKKKATRKAPRKASKKRAKK